MAKRKPKPGPDRKAHWPDFQLKRHLFQLKRKKKIQGVMCEKGWYFWDETGQLGGGPYSNRDWALNGLNTYCRHLDEENPKTIWLRRSLGTIAFWDILEQPSSAGCIRNSEININVILNCLGIKVTRLKPGDMLQVTVCRVRKPTKGVK